VGMNDLWDERVKSANLRAEIARLGAKLEITELRLDTIAKSYANVLRRLFHDKHIAVEEWDLAALDVDAVLPKWRSEKVEK